MGQYRNQSRWTERSSSATSAMNADFSRTICSENPSQAPTRRRREASPGRRASHPAHLRAVVGLGGLDELAAPLDLMGAVLDLGHQ